LFVALHKIHLLFRGKSPICAAIGAWAGETSGFLRETSLRLASGMTPEARQRNRADHSAALSFHFLSQRFRLARRAVQRAVNPAAERRVF